MIYNDKIMTQFNVKANRYRKSLCSVLQKTIKYEPQLGHIFVWLYIARMVYCFERLYKIFSLYKGTGDDNCQGCVGTKCLFTNFQADNYGSSSGGGRKSGMYSHLKTSRSYRPENL